MTDIKTIATGYIDLWNERTPDRRRKMLAGLLAPIPHGILLSDALEGNGANVFRHACGLGLEGIVSKRLGSTYRAGGSPDWIKTMNPDWGGR